MLDQTDPLSDLNLLLLGELTGGPRHVGGRIVELGRRHVALLNVGWRLLKLLNAVAVVGVAVP